MITHNKLIKWCITALLYYATIPSIYAWTPNPVPFPGAVVTSDQARFTVLTSRVIRMEYSDNQQFRDVPTFGILNRLTPAVTYTSQVIDGILTINTDDLVLKYTVGSGNFTESNLEVMLINQVGGQTVTWNISSLPTGNLLGTVRTLDDQDGSVPLYCPERSPDDIYDSHCTLSVISRDGWAIYNDSAVPTFTNDEWKWYGPPQPGDADTSCNAQIESRVDCNPGDGNQQDCENRGCCFSPVNDKLGVPWCYFPSAPVNYYQDLYFFGHGHDYFGAMADFILLSGPIPTFPRYIFGPQYSRWHAFNEVDEVSLIEDKYETLGIPLDVLVLDMDWHFTYERGDNTCNPPVNGWTGFTWDTTLFPDPSRFLSWAHEKGLHITNNMHPAAGVQCVEKEYVNFAKAMGIDYSTNNSISYEIQNQTYAKNFMDIVLQPLTNQGNQMNGIDYWWIDYQQGEANVAYGVNPTFWVNYVFTTAESWWPNDIRPLIMARWGGFGNHRMSTLGFSGDVTTSWQSLAFQPYFTTTASNVGFFWTHDIGGFEGQPDPELYTRWIQWGTMSNMLRTHCDGKKIGGGFTRDIWDYPYSYFSIMQSAFKLRAALVPYTYTQHAKAYTSGVGLLRPLYYHYPEDSNAYTYMTTQYMFGSDILVSPVTSPSPGFNLTEQTIYIPEGTWVEYYSGKIFTGPSSIQRNYSLSEIPVFVKAGAIIPMRSTIDAPTIGAAQEIPSILRLDVFPLSDGSTEIYEDDGKTLAYEAGSYSTTQVETAWTEQSVAMTVSAVTGSFPNMVSTRGYEINLINVWPATNVQFGDNEISYSATGDDETQDWWTYVGSSLTVKINIATPSPVSSDVILKVNFASSLNDTVLQGGFARQLSYLETCKDLLDNENGVYWVSDYPHLLRAAGFGLQLTPNNTVNELPNFAQIYQEAQSDVQNLIKIQSTPEAEACTIWLNSA